MNTKEIQISDYNYPLPDERIAKYPLARRDQSKLLVYDKGEVSDDVFCNLPQHLPHGALMVFNNTRVNRPSLPTTSRCSRRAKAASGSAWSAT